MNYDKDKVDEMVLALLALTMFGDKYGTRAWKGHDWDHLDCLFEQGWIGDPKNKSKSVVFTEEGKQRALELFKRHFGEREESAQSRIASTAGE